MILSKSAFNCSRQFNVCIMFLYLSICTYTQQSWICWSVKTKRQKYGTWRRGGHNYLGNVLYRSFYMDFFNIHIWIIEQLKWNDVEVRWWWYSTKTNISCFQHSHWRSSTIKLCWARCIRLRIEKKSTLFKDLTFGAALIDFNLDQHKIALVIYNEGLHY